ncbi:MAG: hypothetical protein E6575_02940 [Bradyrhizobium sp.]|nr:hypothetical protein [Bradyrhizobium sp.]
MPERNGLERGACAQQSPAVPVPLLADAHDIKTVPGVGTHLGPNKRGGEFLPDEQRPLLFAIGRHKLSRGEIIANPAQRGSNHLGALHAVQPALPGR